MNMSDTERVRTVFAKMGYTATEKEEEAQILGVMACSVRQAAIDRVYSKIHSWNKRKDRESLITFVSGCILPTDKSKFQKLFDLTFPTAEMEKLPDLLNHYGVPTIQSVNSQNLNPVDSEFWTVAPTYTSSFEAFVPIQNGCNKFCAFCAVPYTRGREVSRPSDEILQEVQGLLDKGYTSITLLGQNVNSYGQDKKGEEISFSQLLDQIGTRGDKAPQRVWIYFTSPHPRDMTNEVIDVIAEHPSIADQIHLPLQSGDDKVLIRMNRKHSMDRYRSIVEYARKKIPHIAITTDVIVGFTGETQEQFENTRGAMEEFQYHMAFIAKYSPRPGAASFRWEDDVDMEEKKRRFEVLTETLKASSQSHNEALVGQTTSILLQGVSRDGQYLIGRTEGKVNVRVKTDDHSLIGKILDVKVVAANPFSVEGELLPVHV